MKKQLEILDNELEILKQDRKIHGVMITGSVAYGAATEDSDLDMLVLCDKDKFVSKNVNDILVEIHFQKYKTARKKLENNPMEVYKYIYSKIIFDDGKITQLFIKANEIYQNYKTSTKEMEDIFYWLLSIKDKLLSALKNNDTMKISYILATNTWKLLEGIWAVNNKPMPPASLAFNTHNNLNFPLDNWFEDLFADDIILRAKTMIKIINIICK